MVEVGGGVGGWTVPVQAVVGFVPVVGCKRQATRVGEVTPTRRTKWLWVWDKPTTYSKHIQQDHESRLVVDLCTHIVHTNTHTHSQREKPTSSAYIRWFTKNPTTSFAFISFVWIIQWSCTGTSSTEQVKVRPTVRDPNVLILRSRLQNALWVVSVDSNDKCTFTSRIMSLLHILISIPPYPWQKIYDKCILNSCF